jgi:hypothetical protein
VTSDTAVNEVWAATITGIAACSGCAVVAVDRTSATQSKQGWTFTGLGQPWVLWQQSEVAGGFSKGHAAYAGVATTTASSTNRSFATIVLIVS